MEHERWVTLHNKAANPDWPEGAKLERVNLAHVARIREVWAGRQGAEWVHSSTELTFSTAGKAALEVTETAAEIFGESLS